MTDEEIIAVAEATGLKLITLGLDKQKSEFLILAFAKQIAKLERYHEREACATIADTWVRLTDKVITQVIDSMPKKMRGFYFGDWDLYELARAIESKIKDFNTRQNNACII